MKTPAAATRTEPNKKLSLEQKRIISEDMRAVAGRLRAAMKQANKTQAAIVMSLRGTGYPVKEATLSTYVNGKSAPSHHVLREIAKVCRVRYYWLLEGEEPMTSPAAVEYRGRPYLDAAFPIAEFDRWIQLVETLGFSKAENLFLTDLAFRTQTMIDLAGLGDKTNGAGKREYHPSSALRDAVRLSFLAWIQLFEAAIRSEGRERFVELLRKRLLRGFVARHPDFYDTRTIFAKAKQL